jgi:glycosyltransferase involved in cell wall biosynthesis
MEAGCLTEISPLLTVAIPTWNRAAFLAQTLEQLRLEMVATLTGAVEVLVSDNCSQDETLDVVQAAQAAGLVIRYVRNSENIGSDANIAQCFNLAQGKYVLILGDDDLFVDGALPWLLHRLEQKDYGVVCMRPYGFEADFRKEYPGGAGEDREFCDGGVFLAAIGSLVTLISSCVINKSLLLGVDAREFCGGNLVQVHLVIRAALLAKDNLFANRYLMACKRNNSGGYDFSRVFVEELGRILDSYQSMGLTPASIRAFEKRLLVGYYPFYLLRQRLARQGDLAATSKRFADRFGERWLYRLWIAPILYFPRPFAILWGAGVTVVGRIANGDLRRGAVFARNRILGNT